MAEPLHIYYVNFSSACGCGEYQTALVKLGMCDDTGLAARQTAAAQKILNKMSLPYMRSQCSCLMDSARSLPPSFFSRLSLLRPQLHAHEKRSIGASENCDKEERTPEGHLGTPSEAATSAAPDGLSASAALGMATCDRGGGGDGSWPSSSSSSSSPAVNGKEPAVPLPVVESMN